MRKKLFQASPGISAAKTSTRGNLLLELRDYLLVLRRNWITIVALALVGLLLAGTNSLLTKPVYTAKTELFVSPQNSGSLAEMSSGNSYLQSRVASYVKTATTPAVLQPVIDTLGLPVSPQQLASTVTAASVPGTVLLTITVDNGSPVQAAAIAQAVANSLLKTVDDLETPRSGDVSLYRVSVVTPAIAPTSPSGPNTKKNLALGLAIGLALGAGASLLRQLLDTRIRSERDLKSTFHASVLGRMNYDPDVTKNPVLSDEVALSQRAESYRQLRTNLQFAHVSHKSKTLLVTSSLPGEGKSITATNLAISIAETGQSVALVDADLRRPSVATYLGLESQAGLTTALIGQAEVQDLLQPWGKHKLHVLTSGRIPPNPSELLGSTQMKNLIDQLEQDFDTVIIDAPPLLPVTDSAVLARQVGGVLLVVGCHMAKKPQVDKALSALELVDADILGVVLNQVPPRGPDAYAYDYYGYAAESVDSGSSTSLGSQEARVPIDESTEDAFDDILQGRSARRARQD